MIGAQPSYLASSTAIWQLKAGPCPLSLHFMTSDLIRYDVLTQDALRGVVRKVLVEVTQTGLPGEHHFFITFDTNHPSVRISSRLRAQYPDEMTIVLQHQFWELSITDAGMEVGLSFNGVPERLIIPFSAMTAFADPHASFGIKFDTRATQEGSGSDADAGFEPGEGEAAGGSRPDGAVPAIPADLNSLPMVNEAGNEDEPEPKPKETGQSEPEPEPDSGSVTDSDSDTDSDKEDQESSGGAEVVSLDAFRKK